MNSPTTHGLPGAGSRSNGTPRHYGKYRGTVVNVIDPEFRGRIMALVPDVSNVIPTTWAMPCLPWAGLQMGAYILPPIGAGVWIEFEQGDPDYPIWTGCWWGSVAEAPLGAKAVVPETPVFMIESLRKAGLVLSDFPVPPQLPAGGIVIKSSTSYIRVDETGITLFGPMIRINGVTMVDINGGALTVAGPAPPT